MDLVASLEAALGSRYAIEAELGRGGMAIVYRAKDLRQGRHVAIKVLRPDLAATIAADRFLREIRIVAQLQHPHILPLHDSGEAGGFLYYVMPYVEGDSLRARLAREKPLPIPDAIRITCEVASALDYAHARGFVHRDVKPENILLSSGRAIVADFGVARAIMAAGGERVTETGLAVGTPSYMSPEQSGAETGLDGRSDVYSLACVLFEMLSGDPPFTGPSPHAVVARQMWEPPPSLRVVRPTVPPELEETINRALAKIPADRFQTAGAFGDALETVGSASKLTRLRTRRRASYVALGFTIIAAVAIGLAFTVRPLGSTLDANKVVVFPLMERGLASGDTGVGYDVALMIGAALEHTDPLKWIDGRQHLDERTRANSDFLTTRAARTISRERGARYFLEGIARQQLDSTVVILRLHDAAGDSLVAQETASGAKGRMAAHGLGLAAVRRLLPRLLDPGRRIDLDPLADRRPAAIALWIQGEREYRRARFSSALEFYERAVREDSALAFAAVKGAQAANWINSRSEARELVRNALAHEALLPRRHRFLARGLEAYLTGRSDSAVTWLERAVADDSQWSEAWMALGDVFYHLFPSRAPLDSLAEAAFERSLAADSTFAPPMLHLVEIAVRRGEIRRASALMERLRRAEPDDTTLVQQRELMLECVERGPERLDWHAAARENSLALLLAAQALAVGATHSACAEAGFRAVGSSGAPGDRWAALLGLNGVLAAHGRTADLVMLLDSAVAAGTSQALWLYVIDAAAGIPVESKAATMEAVARQRFGNDYNGARPHVLWLLGVWHARMGNPEKLRQLYAALTEDIGEPGARRTRLLSDALGAHLALAQADTATAIARLTRLTPTAGMDSLVWDLFEPLAVERLTLARLLLAREQLEDAHRVAEVFDHPEPTIYLPFLPASLAVRLRVAERLGRTDAAAKYRARLRALGRGDLIASR